MINFLKNRVVHKTENAIGHAKQDNEHVWFVTRKVAEHELPHKHVLPKRWFFRKTKVVELGEPVQDRVHLPVQVMSYRDIREGQMGMGTLGMVVFGNANYSPLYFSDEFLCIHGDFLRDQGFFKPRAYVITNSHVAHHDMQPKDGDEYGQPTALSEDNLAFGYVKHDNNRDFCLLKAKTALGEKWIQKHKRPYKVRDVKRNELVHKRGRTTGWTTGFCIYKNVTVEVEGKRCTGLDVFTTNDPKKPISMSGDSGAVYWVKGTDYAVSHNCAGSINTQGVRFGFGYPLRKTFMRHNIRLTWDGELDEDQ